MVAAGGRLVDVATFNVGGEMAGAGGTEDASGPTVGSEGEGEQPKE